MSEHVEYFSETRAARYLRMRQAALRKLRLSKQVSHYMVLGRPRYTVEQLQDFLERNRVDAVSPVVSIESRRVS